MPITSSWTGVGMKTKSKENEYFDGWYFKCQKGQKTLAVIPAIHRRGLETVATLQVITEAQAWSLTFPAEAYRSYGAPFPLRIGENLFSERGMRLKIASPGLSLEGKLTFGAFCPPHYDIMGPFALVPGMECRHRVASMYHTVDGCLCLNGQTLDFTGAQGYLEGDAGRSFPEEYAWTHCFFPGGSLMLSAASIPLGRLRFPGVIGFVFLNGREYRLGSYLGARLLMKHNGTVVIGQSGDLFLARLLKKRALALRAPQGGLMARTIRESAACRTFYRFYRNGQCLLSLDSHRASFEYEFPE